MLNIFQSRTWPEPSWMPISLLANVHPKIYAFLPSSHVKMRLQRRCIYMMFTFHVTAKFYRTLQLEQNHWINGYDIFMGIWKICELSIENSLHKIHSKEIFYHYQKNDVWEDGENGHKWKLWISEFYCGKTSDHAFYSNFTLIPIFLKNNFFCRNWSWINALPRKLNSMRVVMLRENFSKSTH